MQTIRTCLGALALLACGGRVAQEGTESTLTTAVDCQGYADVCFSRYWPGYHGDDLSQPFDPDTRNPICLPRPPVSDAHAQVACSVLEVREAGCDCTQPGRVAAAPALRAPVSGRLREWGLCDRDQGVFCSSFCMCAIAQESGAAARACAADPAAAARAADVPPGFCYSDDAASFTLAKCPPDRQQALLFVSSPTQPTPLLEGVTVVACGG